MYEGFASFPLLVSTFFSTIVKMRLFSILTLVMCVNAQECLTTVECNTFVNRYQLFYYLHASNCRFDDYCINQCTDIAQCPYPSFGSPYVTDYQYRSVSGSQVGRPTSSLNTTICDNLGLQLKQAFKQVMNALTSMI